jgi:hypothetical protein
MWFRPLTPLDVLLYTVWSALFGNLRREQRKEDSVQDAQRLESDLQPVPAV